MRPVRMSVLRRRRRLRPFSMRDWPRCGTSTLLNSTHQRKTEICTIGPSILAVADTPSGAWIRRPHGYKNKPCWNHWIIASGHTSRLKIVKKNWIWVVGYLWNTIVSQTRGTGNFFTFLYDINKHILHTQIALTKDEDYEVCFILIIKMCAIVPFAPPLDLRESRFTEVQSLVEVWRTMLWTLSTALIPVSAIAPRGCSVAAQHTIS